MECIPLGFLFIVLSVRLDATLTKRLQESGSLRLWMEFFVMTPEVSLWDFKMLSAIMSLVSFLFSAALLGEIWIGSWWRRRGTATKATTAMCEGRAMWRAAADECVCVLQNVWNLVR